MILKTLANDAVNFKGSRILKNKYRIKSSFSCHSSHISAGTIRKPTLQQIIVKMMQSFYMKTLKVF